MILVIGAEHCSNCKIVKSILENKGVEFEYKLTNEISSDELEKYMGMAEEIGQIGFPLIIKDNKIITVQEA